MGDRRQGGPLARPTAGAIVMGAVVGAVLGGVFGVVRGKVKHGRTPGSRPSDDLGYEWKRVRTDYDLCEFLGRLKAFRHASEEHYRTVGDACDDMVDLMLLLHDPTVPTQALWQTKSFRYVRRVGDALAALSDAVVEARRLASAQLVAENRAKRAGRRTTTSTVASGDMAEFEACAGGIYGIMENYHASIARTIAVRGGGGGAASAMAMHSASATLGDNDGSDNESFDSDASDLDSAYSDDDDDGYEDNDDDNNDDDR
ncbi:hypothetical protein pmac_cds_200 [Pandoravirus macleodensis]|uniref:Uncharacterized protein n=1 Tax=Pandoravirus macleodensis TaxID=2107707 RepID=A0A2U7UEJ8_9VIRU|nr:hypothetical protein pmac_cds_200 [Pandoravirus macleodensis]AVK76888.1 hypothetical protein pmac_cds_200 [Pandoravirus macleodensis]UMO79491.1 hypothetical protein [Pandoravirus aubagnensis]